MELPRDSKSEVQSNLLGAYCAYDGGVAMPTFVDSLGVSVGSVLAAYDRAMGATIDDNTRTVTLSGLSVISPDFQTTTAFMTQLFGGVGLGLSSWTSTHLLLADGRQLEIRRPVLAGIAAQVLDVGGTMYLRSTLNLAASSVVNLGVQSAPAEKSDIDAVVLQLAEQKPLPFVIEYSPSSGGTVGIGGGPGKGSTFVATQVSARMSPVKLEGWATYMPFGLEAYAINPKNGHFTQGNPPGGFPLTMSEDIMLLSDRNGGVYAPQWQSLGISMNGGRNEAAGVYNPDRYWQSGGAHKGPVYGITLTVGGFFMEPDSARALFSMLEPSETSSGSLLVYGADDAGAVYFSNSRVSMTGHSLSQDTQAFGGRPALAATLTFEIPGGDNNIVVEQ